MDNVTHALAGSLLAAATVAYTEKNDPRISNRFPAIATAVGIITAELPDADLLYAGQSLGMGKLGYLLYHRGHTHTLLFAILAALVVWLAVLFFRRDIRVPAARNALLVLAMLGTLSHLVLDYSNNYGIHPFWPVVNRWYYGDAVFIVEPWLWVVSIPALFAIYASRIAKSVLALAMLAILAATWIIPFVGRDVALATLLATGVWFFVVRRVAARSRAVWALYGWCAVELLFFAAGWRAHTLVRTAVGSEAFRDAALTPGVGNPLCYSGTTVEVTAGTYKATNVTVAPFAALRDAARCANVGVRRGSTAGTQLSARTQTPSLVWDHVWIAPVADLQRLVSVNCEVAAAMQFIRVPAWAELQNGDVEIRDMRFGEVGGFAGIVARGRVASCPRFVPGWIPPRQDLLTGLYVP